MTKIKRVNIIGAGLAGAEAAFQVAEAGISVRLFEMRPVKSSPVHHTPYFGELVCSNSLRAAGVENAVGLLKEEMRRQNSLIMACADEHRLPAGGALAVDREGFAKAITEKVSNHPNVEVIYEEVTNFDHLYNEEEILIIAAGPLASDALADEIQKLIGDDYLHFHDAVAPIVAAETIDMSVAYRASRYDKGENPDGDYLNCPMDKEQYLKFYHELVAASLVPLKDFEAEKHFDGCMPVESMARSGVDTIRFGPLKPVGLPNPHKDNREEYAVVQLRQDNASGTMYNIVGFQTRLTWGEQKRVFQLIPALENAEFLRFGVMHRNTFINSTKLLNRDLSLKSEPNIYFAGQITGVEGYVESAAAGLAVGINAARKVLGKDALIYPTTTAIGGLISYVTTPIYNFQPMNVTMGLIDALGMKIRKKKEKNALIAKRSFEDLSAFLAENGQAEFETAYGKQVIEDEMMADAIAATEE